MPLYDVGTVYRRKTDNRLTCSIGNKRYYKYRIDYCNYHNIKLEDIKGMIIHHKDGNSKNDDINNLELLTHLEHAHKHPGRASFKHSAERRKQHSEVLKKAWRNGKFNNRKEKRSIYDDISSNILEMVNHGWKQIQIAYIFNMPRTSVQRFIYKWRRNGSLSV